MSVSAATNCVTSGSCVTPADPIAKTATVWVSR